MSRVYTADVVGKIEKDVDRSLVRDAKNEMFVRMWGYHFFFEIAYVALECDSSLLPDPSLGLRNPRLS